MKLLILMALLGFVSIGADKCSVNSPSPGGGASASVMVR